MIPYEAQFAFLDTMMTVMIVLVAIVTVMHWLIYQYFSRFRKFILEEKTKILGWVPTGKGAAAGYELTIENQVIRNARKYTEADSKRQKESALVELELLIRRLKGPGGKT